MWVKVESGTSNGSSVRDEEVAVLRILLVRHGQTALNAGSAGGEHFRGRIDVALNETGLAQAQSVANRLSGLHVTAVYASPLQRALCTALPIAEVHGLEVVPFEGLLDIDFGLWGGHSFGKVAEEWPELYRQWRTTPHRVQIPGGESLAAVRSRISGGLDEITARHHDEMVVLVGHQVVNKVLVCVMLGLENSAFWRVRQDTCCINRFDFDGTTFTVLTLNEVGHLPSWPPDLDRLPG
jgi:broad specificity phosphatase PhoE